MYLVDDFKEQRACCIDMHIRQEPLATLWHPNSTSHTVTTFVRVEHGAMCLLCVLLVEFLAFSFRPPGVSAYGWNVLYNNFPYVAHDM